MPEDRLGDLGRGGSGDGGRRRRDPVLGDDSRPASERLAELDERRPEQPLSDAGTSAEEQPPRRRGGRYLGVLAVAFAALVVVAAFNTARDLANDRGLLRGPPPGSRLPDFAAPLATGSLEGDANVREGAGGGAAAGARQACEVRSPEVVNVCQLRERPLVLTFVVTRGADCAPALNAVERVRRDFPQVNFAAVVSGSERRDVAELVRRRGISMPVAVDRDGAIVNAYRVGVCPTTVFAAPGGVVRDTRLGGLGEPQLRRAAASLARGRSR